MTFLRFRSFVLTVTLSLTLGLVTSTATKFEQLETIFHDCTFYIYRNRSLPGIDVELDKLAFPLVTPYQIGDAIDSRWATSSTVCSVDLNFIPGTLPTNATFALVSLTKTGGLTSTQLASLTKESSRTVYVVWSEIVENEPQPVNKLTVSVVCAHCPQKLVQLTSDLSTLTWISILVEWRAVSRNLYGNSILYPDLDGLQGLSDCTSLGREFLGEERICTIKAVVTKVLNGTLIFKEADALPPSRILGTVRNTLLGSLTELWRYEFLPNGYVFEPYTFAVVLNKETGTRFDLNPLGKMTELAKNVTVVVLSVVFALRMTIPRRKSQGVLWSRAKRRLSKRFLSKRIGQLPESWGSTFLKRMSGPPLTFTLKFITTFVQIAKSMVEQGDSQIRSILTLDPSDFVYLTLLSIWLLTSSNVITAAYKGGLFSMLTDERPIDGIPQTLHDLVSSSFPIISTDNRLNMATLSPDSILQDLILEQLQTGHLTPTDKPIYKTLHNRFILLAASQGLVVGAYDTKVDIGDIMSVPSRNKTDVIQKFQLPRNFALFGFYSTTLHFSTVMKDLESVFVLRNSYVDPYLSLKLVTATSRNSFGQRLFPRPYSSIHESGIYRKWAENRERLFLEWDRAFTRCLQFAQNPQEAYDTKRCPGDIHSSNKNKSVQGSKLKGLTLGIVVKLISNILWIGLLISLVSFFLEVTLGLLTRVRVTYQFHKVLGYAKP